MFKPKPGYKKQWNFRKNNVSAVPLQNDGNDTKTKQETNRVRRNLEELKKKDEALHAKNRLLTFVTQKLLNNFGHNHKQTIAACVEAFFDVKNSFTTDDINGLERVIRESIRNQQQQQRQSNRPKTPMVRQETAILPQMEVEKTHNRAVEHTAALLQAISARKERRQKTAAAAASSMDRNGTSLKNFKEGLDEQIMFNREVKEKARQQWLQEAQQAAEERERIRQSEIDKREREAARRDELKRIQMQQIAERRARDLAERESQRIEDRRNLLLLDQQHMDKSRQLRTASRCRSRFTSHKNLEGSSLPPRPSTSDGAYMRRSFSTTQSGLSGLSGLTPSEHAYADYEETAQHRQSQHAMFGLLPESDHGLLESETYKSRANSASLSARRPVSASAITTALGVSAHTLKNALLARSAVLTAGTWVEAGATGAPAAFSRHAAIAAQYANSRMLAEQQKREELERRNMQMDAKRANDRALTEEQTDTEESLRKDTETKRLNKEDWLGAVEVRTREKKRWEEGMSPMERAINRGLLQKMKHYDRQRASSAPSRGRSSPERICSSHGALSPQKWQ